MQYIEKKKMFFLQFKSFCTHELSIVLWCRVPLLEDVWHRDKMAKDHLLGVDRIPLLLPYSMHAVYCQITSCCSNCFVLSHSLWWFPLLVEVWHRDKMIKDQGGISSSVLSVFFTDKFALSQSDASRISVAYKICQWKTLTKHLMKCPPALRSS